MENNTTFNTLCDRILGLAEISIDSAPKGTQVDMYFTDQIHITFFIESKYGNPNVVSDYVIPFLKKESVDLATALRECKGEMAKIGRMYSGRAFTYVQSSLRKDAVGKLRFNMFNQLSEVTIWLKGDEARKNLVIMLDMLYLSNSYELEANLEWLDKTFPIDEE